MGATDAKKRPNWLAPVLVAALVGACYYYWLAGPVVNLKPETDVVLAAGKSGDYPEGASPAAGAVTGAATAAPLANPVALEYISAYQ